MNNMTENRVEGTIRLCTFTEKKLQVEKNISESTFSELLKLLKLTIFRGNVKEERSWCIVAKKHSGILNHPPILSHLPDCWQP